MGGALVVGLMGEDNLINQEHDCEAQEEKKVGKRPVSWDGGLIIFTIVVSLFMSLTFMMLILLKFKLSPDRRTFRQHMAQAHYHEHASREARTK